MTLPLTVNRIQTPLDALIYYAECAVATYAESLMQKKFSQAQRERYRRIAQGMVGHARTFAYSGFNVEDVAEEYRDRQREWLKTVENRLSTSEAREPKPKE